MPTPGSYIKRLILLLLSRLLLSIVLGEGWLPFLIGDRAQVLARVLTEPLLVAVEHRRDGAQVSDFSFSLGSEAERVLDGWVHASLHEVVYDADVPSGQRRHQSCVLVLAGS